MRRATAQIQDKKPLDAPLRIKVRDLLQEFQKRIPESVRRHIRWLAPFGAAVHRMDSRFRGNDYPTIVLAEAGTQANARLGITRKLIK